MSSDTSNSIMVVDINGTPHELLQGVDADFDVFARRSGRRFFVLASSDGDLFDPLDIQCNINKKDRERGGKFWRLRTCSQECYGNYTSFLRCKNRTPYTIAQRRFRNDF